MLKKAIIIMMLLSLILVIGCDRGGVNNLAVAREELQERAYSKVEIRLERLVGKQPQNAEAQCLLAAAYNRQSKTQKLEATVGKIRELGKPAIEKTVDIMRHEQNLAEDMAKVLILVGEPATGALVPLLGDTTEYVRENAVQILTKIGAPATGRLKEALDSPDAVIKSGAARVLGNIGDKTAIQLLVKKLDDTNSLVRVESAIALYKLGDKSHVDAINKGLSADIVSAKRSAAIAIRDIVENPAADPLLKASKDNDVQVRSAVIRALGKVKDERAIIPLIEAIKAKDSDIRNAAADSLKEIGELATMPLVNLIKQEQDIATLQKAIQTLGDIGDKRAVDTLEKIYAESKQSLVKQEAAIALNKIE